MDKEQRTIEELIKSGESYSILIIAPQSKMQLYRDRMANFFEKTGFEWHMKNLLHGGCEFFNVKTHGSMKLWPESFCRIDNFLRGHRFDLIILDWTTLVSSYLEDFSPRLFEIGREIRLFNNVVKERS